MSLITTLEMKELLDALVGSEESAEILNAKQQIKTTNLKKSLISPSRKRFSVERTNVGASIEDRQDNDFSLGQPGMLDFDRFREAAAKYWSESEEGGSGVAVWTTTGLGINPEAKVPFSIHIPTDIGYDPHPTSFGGDRDPYFEITQLVKISGDEVVFSKKESSPLGDSISADTDKWEAFVEGNVGEYPDFHGMIHPNIEYNYLAYTSPLPFSHKVLDKLSLTGCQYVKINPEYNFYIKGYEEAHRFGVAQNLPETWLPNLYAIALEKGNDISNIHLNRHVSADNTLTDGAVPEFRSVTDNYGQYFEVWTRNLSPISELATAFGGTINDTLMGQEVAPKFKNVVVPYDTMPSLKEYSKYKELFPMFVDIEFTTDRSTEFAQALADTKLIDEFVWHIAKQTKALSEEMTFIEFDEVFNAEVQEDGTILNKKISQSTSKSRRVWNIMNSWLKSSSLIDFTKLDGGWFGDLSDSLTNASLPNSVFLDDGTSENKLLVEPPNNFFKNLLSTVFVSKLKTFIKDKFVTYDQMMTGRPCYAEDVVYKIEKSLADAEGNPTDDIIQNFWLPNSNEIGVVNFVDTQVKYGKRYAYRFYAYKLVINTKYQYQPAQESGDFVSFPQGLKQNAIFTVIQKPEVLLVEEEIFSIDHLILDDPPIPPEVDIVPYFADGNKLLFNLKSAVGEYSMDPIIISMEDIGWHDDVRVAQKTPPGGQIRFKGDDQIAAFEIYRIDNRPKSWDEFDASIIATVTNETASTGEYLDRISSNRKYYYMFRAIDVHGHLSNPTDIYEVELVNDEGSIYLNKNIVDLEPREPKNPTKSMRRLLEIKPAIEQTFISTSGEEQSAFDFKSLELGGDLQESPWGRKFKFRIVSRKTGKKMDINIDFKAELDKLK